MTKRGFIEAIKENRNTHSERVYVYTEIAKFMYTYHKYSIPKQFPSDRYLLGYFEKNVPFKLPDMLEIAKDPFTEQDIQETLGNKYAMVTSKIVNAQLIMEGFYYFLMDDSLIPLALLAHKGGCRVQCNCSGHYDVSASRIMGSDMYLWLQLPNAGCKARLARVLKEFRANGSKGSDKLYGVRFDMSDCGEIENSVTLRSTLLGTDITKVDQSTITYLLDKKDGIMRELTSAVVLINSVIRSESENYGGNND